MIVSIEDIGHGRETANEVRAIVAKLAKVVPDLWEPYEDKSFARGIDTNKDHWNNEYRGQQQVYLDTNFSKKRCDHLIDVYEYLSK